MKNLIRNIKHLITKHHRYVWIWCDHPFCPENWRGGYHVRCSNCRHYTDGFPR